MSDWKTDGRIRPVFIKIDGERKVAFSNGKGKLFRRDGQSIYDPNRIDKDMLEVKDFEYIRGCNAHDF